MKLTHRFCTYDRLYRAAACGVVLSLSVLVHAQSGEDPEASDPACKIPYTATQWATTSTTMPNGTVMTVTNQMDFARSSTDQVRMAVHLNSQGTERKTGQPVTRVVIMDHEKGTMTVLFVDTHLATTTPMHGPSPMSGKLLPNMTKTDLGTSQIQGLTAIGQRGTYTDGQGVTRTMDSWRSKDLCLGLKMESHDSKNGSSLTELTDIKREEPPASLFEIPADYTVKNPPNLPKF